MPRSAATVLMFPGAAEEAMNFYASLFKGSEIIRIERYGPGEQGAEGSVNKANFKLVGHDLVCSTAGEARLHLYSGDFLIRRMRERGRAGEAFKQLSAGGQALMPPGNYGFSTKFAWVNDRFGFRGNCSWQLNVR